MISTINLTLLSGKTSSIYVIFICIKTWYGAVFRPKQKYFGNNVLYCISESQNGTKTNLNIFNCLSNFRISKTIPKVLIFR